MTLIVSLRVPDGVVIAGDSFSSVLMHVGMSTDVVTKCPNCENDIELKDVQLPPVPFPSTSYSYTQKVFSFLGKAGIGAFGLNVINKRTIYHHIKGLEGSPKQFTNKAPAEIANILGEYFTGEFIKEDENFKKNVGEHCPFGLQYVTCEGGAPVAFEVNIKKELEIKEHDDLSCTVSGDSKIVIKMWELGRADPRKGPNIPAFSLQDAIDYAEYLINTTAVYQRFSSLRPTVGGEIDIGLVTPFGRFTWIKLKELTKIMEEDLGKGAGHDKRK